MNKKLILLTILILVSFIGLAINNSIKNRTYNATLTIEVAPTGSKIQINDKKGKVGKNKLKPGKYTVTASKEGFEKVSKTVELSKNSQDYVGIVLESNSESTKNWYENNPKDQRLAESVSSSQFDRNSEKISNDPIISKLPFIGPGLSWRIDYKNTNEDGKVVLNISYFDDQDKADAIEWIKNEGLNPNNYIFNYYNEIESEELGE